MLTCENFKVERSRLVGEKWRVNPQPHFCLTFFKAIVLMNSGIYVALLIDIVVNTLENVDLLLPNLNPILSFDRNG